MENTQYNLQFDKLCYAACIGNLLCEPMQLTGGLLHRMYAIETKTGKYAVKALNPQVMIRPKAMSDIVNGERIATVAAHYIPALPAKQFDGKAVLEIDGQYYMIYDWLEGSMLYGENIEPGHCEQIGKILGTLHTVDFSSLNIPVPTAIAEKPVDWDEYLTRGRQAGLPWIDELSLSLDRLYNWNSRYLASMKYLESPFLIGHGDIDPKNVMWCDGKPVIIDWESAGYLNPAHELIVYALYWSTLSEKVNKAKFTAFLNGYLSSTTLENVDWQIVIDAGLSPHWLEYSLKRSLGIESADATEQQMGTDHVFGTINYLKRYDMSISQIVEWLTKICTHG